jgi:tetratricopeptide (TPR) repeat protein
LGFILLCFLHAGMKSAAAETIYLKSGLSISVSRTQEKDGQILYWVGDDQYSIDKAEVVKIEKADAPISPTGPMLAGSGVQDLTRRETGASNQHEKLKVPVPTGPKQNDAYWSKIRDRIMVADVIDEQRLAEIEIQHDNRATADAFYLAAVTEAQRGNAGKASEYFEHAVQAMPDRLDILTGLASTLAAQGKYAEAASEFERATSLKPDSAELLALLGMARYNADRTRDAIAAWKQSLELSPDANVQRLLHKAQRELEVEEKLRSKDSLHFTLHYEGERISPDLQQQILVTLENGFQDIARQLGYQPAENIIVILYTQKEFVDITEAPTWASALNDGKLRIPLGGILAVDPELERVLRHELTHSFLHWLARGRCPTWLNEGLAQLMEPRSAAIYARQLAPLMTDRKAIPFSVLEHSFTRFSNLQAQIAYAESLSAAEYLRNRYGMDEIVRMMQSIGSGVAPETALTNSTGMDYDVLEQRIGEQLARE